MEYLTKKNSKTAQILENQLKVELDKKVDKQNKTTFSYFYSMIPNEILGVPLAEIKRDFSEMSQLGSM